MSWNILLLSLQHSSGRWIRSSEMHFIHKTKILLAQRRLGLYHCLQQTSIINKSFSWGEHLVRVRRSSEYFRKRRRCCNLPVQSWPCCLCIKCFLLLLFVALSVLLFVTRNWWKKCLISFLTIGTKNDSHHVTRYNSNYQRIHPSR